METRIRASIVCVYNDSLLVFKGVDPTSLKTYWFLPGGKIENNESPWSCAEREAFEETGYRIQSLRESETIKEYLHWWDGNQYLCKTFFYRGVLTESWSKPKPVIDADYNKGVEWLNLDAAIASFAYTKEIQEAVIALTR